MLLEARDLSKTFPGPRPVKGLDGVSISLAPGETLGLVGPSGSGKSTLARVIARLTPPDQGSIGFDGRDWLALQGRALRHARAGMQMVFQDPAAAFHPRASVASALTEALRLHSKAPRRDWPEMIASLLGQVGLSPDLAPRSLREISGGQRQRIAIARAIATRPKLIILDEAVSALDASVRARIIELLVRLQNDTGVAYLFVSHDLALVRQIAHRTAVMAEGRVIETGPTLDLIARPKTELTRRLIAAIPELISPAVKV